ncbi:DUF1361 domain-containing protein [Candidatus Peregrinibacteria bacterium]|nr:MAG: DUF1361 domain-containing protein [Candidatus Peregrinibacteria bacterium]
MNLRYLLLFDLVIVGVRMLVTGTPSYAFLVYNLFLAFIPFALSTWAFRKEWKGASCWILFGLSWVWLFFLPNAPYLLTDFYHLKWKTEMSMLWYDIQMLFFYALTALFFFYKSLQQAEQLWLRFFKRGGGFFIGAVVFLCSYAIYLGRYLRFNTWDLILQPWAVFQDMILAPQTLLFWQIVLPFFFFLLPSYFLFKNLHHK